MSADSCAIPMQGEKWMRHTDMRSPSATVRGDVFFVEDIVLVTNRTEQGPSTAVPAKIVRFYTKVCTSTAHRVVTPPEGLSLTR